MGLREVWLRHRHARERSMQQVVSALERQNVLLGDIRAELRRQRPGIIGKDARSIDAIVTNVLSDPMRESVRSFIAERCDDMWTTVELLGRDGRSFTRFGDGEFKLMFRPDISLRFQRNTAALREALHRAYTQPVDGLLVGFPHYFHTLHWTMIWTDLWAEVSEATPVGARFGDSHVTRPIFFESHGQAGVDLWRNVWDTQNVSVVTGRGSRFELIDPLFDNVKDVEFVWSEPENAFDDLDRVFAQIESAPSADLHLISLGPAGTVLAAQLAERGHRAIDIGHISDSWRVAFEGADFPERRSTRQSTGDERDDRASR